MPSISDIQLNNSDIDLSQGDIQIASSTAAHQQQLLLCNKGEYKEQPTVGVGALLYWDDEDYGGLIRAIHTEFTRDGMTVNNVSLSANGVINCDASY